MATKIEDGIFSIISLIVGGAKPLFLFQSMPRSRCKIKCYQSSMNRKGGRFKRRKGKYLTLTRGDMKFLGQNKWSILKCFFLKQSDIWSRPLKSVLELYLTTKTPLVESTRFSKEALLEYHQVLSQHCWCII